MSGSLGTPVTATLLPPRKGPIFRNFRPLYRSGLVEVTAVVAAVFLLRFFFFWALAVKAMHRQQSSSVGIRFIFVLFLHDCVMGYRMSVP